MSENLELANKSSDISHNFDDFDLEWKNINVTTVIKPKSIYERFKRLTNKSLNKKKHILEKVSGKIKSGTLVALMGESGAGKTTLLNVLSGNIHKNIKVKGNISVGGARVNMNKISCYVQQVDLFFANLTVKEHLMFNIVMKLGNQINKKEILDKIKNISVKFKLDKCLNTKVGDGVTVIGISGGEKKRLSIAIETISNPKLIFADEPTSGLDNFMAHSVISSLYDIATRNRIVICTIHQPNAQLFNIFHEVIIMCSGRCVAMGNLKSVIDYFDNCGYPCPKQCNISDHLINVVAYDPNHPDNQTQVLNKLLGDRDNEDGTTAVAKTLTVPKVKFLSEKYPTNSVNQFYLLLKRETLITLRTPMLSYAKLAEAIFLGLLIGLIYLRLDRKISNSQNYFGSIFFIVTSLTFRNVFPTLMVFINDLSIFRREHKNILYRTTNYFLAKFVLDFIRSFFNNIVFISICYWMIGFNPNFLNFVLFMIVSFLISSVSIAYGYLISSLVNTFAMASAISTPLIIPLLLFGGFYLKTNDIPIYFRWIRYISWFNYGFKLLVQICFRNTEIICDDPRICGIDLGKPTSANIMLNALGLETTDKDYNTNWIGLCCLVLGYNVLAYFILLLKTYLNEI